MKFFMIAVAALLAALLLAPRTALGKAPETCTPADVGIQYCQDCQNGVTCEKEEESPVPNNVICTKPGQACKEVSGLSICVPLVDSPCNCTNVQQCDAYDDSALLVCLNGDSSTIIISQCTPPLTCNNDICSEPTVAPDDLCVNKPDGWVVVTPQCTSAVYCVNQENRGPTNCLLPDEYFDPDAGHCAPAPPVSCDGSCMGMCPDKTNCSRYYVCDTSSHGYLQDCPADKPLFDTVSNTCMEKEATPTPPTCTKTDGCVFGGTTTSPLVSPITTTTSEGGPGPTTTAATTTTDGNVTPMPPQCNESNVNHRYPNEENCKMYVLCALVAPGQYQYLNMTCPGNYVYNPTTTYCDYPGNVPDCVVPTTIALHDIDTNEER